MDRAAPDRSRADGRPDRRRAGPAAVRAPRGEKPGAEHEIRALLAKAEPPRSGRIRGFRHTMLDDSDIAATRHARAAVGGALASLVGHGEIYVSGGAEHQGPDGGGPVAVIVDASRDPG